MHKALVLVIVLAGCVGAGDPPEAPPEDPPAPPAPPAPGGPTHASLDGFVRDADGAVEGAAVRVGATGLTAQSAADGSFAFDGVPPGRHAVRADFDGRNGSVTIELAAGDVRTVFIDIGSDKVAPPIEEAPPVPGVFSCPDGDVAEEHATFGSDGDLVWAALKTGFRAVLAWEGGADTLHYSIDGGAVQTARDASRVFVLDGLPEGGTLCFHNGGDWHAMRLGNAMNAYGGVYTANFLLMANERSNKAILEKGVQRFADLMWDASEGRIRVGAVIAVFDHHERQQEALQPCWNSNPGVHVSVFEGVLCDRWFDLIFTHNVNPAAAGATYEDGIQEADVPVWMNAIHEAGLLSGLFTEASQVREVGSVLTHEVGHYMYGAQDLYPEANVVSTNCYDARTGISIMSSSRDATEFDSTSTPCSGASSAYRPTWGLMMERFPELAEREGDPLDGPAGDGGVFQYSTFTVGL